MTSSFNLQAAQENMEAVCDYIERMEAPNPLNPVGISELSYHRIMTGLHDETWVRDFVPEVN